MSDSDNLDEDAQRKFEQRALRNVRGLVDKVEQEYATKNALQKGAIWFGVVLGVLLLLFAVRLGFNPENRMTPLDLPGVSSPSGDAPK